MKVSSQRPGLSSSDCDSDPEDKEISEGEDEDDDRNHKHRRREAHSQSLEGDSLDQGLTRPYRKRDRPFDNGYSYREGDPQSGDMWKPYNIASERDFSSRFEKRRPNQGSFSRAPIELNKRIRGNQAMSGEFGLGRGRGREHIPWAIHDSRLGLVNVAPPIVQPGPVSSALFAGRGFTNVSSTQSTSWNAFGLVPGVPNCGLDPLHPLGLQGAIRPAISPPINIGIPRQRCRDFEERGFCLRGDMCPMEHGFNRIVVEDVQSLSQFNLPVSIPGSQLLGTSSGQGALPVTSASSGSLMNNKLFHAKHTKPGMNEDGAVGGSMAVASDVYDPDQPLWTNDNPETSEPLLALNQSNADETESLESYEGFNDDRLLRHAPTDGTHSSYMWGRIGMSKRGATITEKNGPAGASSSYLEQDIKSGDALNTVPNVPYQGKLMNVDGNHPSHKESPAVAHHSPNQSIRRPSQKALRTLFVNGVPVKDNKREALLSHFQKFGEVIDIYIPMHSERAFVQFSRREEAEAALKAPAAVMGNRFIKLWWANRDNIPDDGKTGTSNMAITPRESTINRAVSHLSTLDKGKDNPHPLDVKDGNAGAPQLPGQDHTKLVVATAPKANPPQQKKLETLVLLKEELRKKQEMLDQKRNEFRRQLDKLEKHTVGSKDVAGSDLASKGLKDEIPLDHAKVDPSKSSAGDNNTTEKPVSSDTAAPHTSTSSQIVQVQEPVKPTFRSLAHPSAPFIGSRFKLDNRPTAFRIIPPLPPGLANVAALEEHFADYGDLSSVELEEPELQGANDTSESSSFSARVSFTTRQFAERAFVRGKSWQGHKLQFMWLTSINFGKESATSGNLAATCEKPSDANVRPSSEVAPANSPKVVAVGTGEHEHGIGNLAATSEKPTDANVEPSSEVALAPAHSPKESEEPEHLTNETGEEDKKESNST